MANCCFSQCQGPFQAWLRPGYWIPGVRNLHSCRQTWDLDGTPSENFDRLSHFIEENERQQNWILRQANSDTHFIQIFTYTPSQWLDVTEIQLQPGPQSGTRAVCKSFSSGFLPVCVPGAPLWNAIFCFVPFSDMNLGEKRLNMLNSAASSKEPV
ncbi:uncharacterized protein LOC135821298 isoform X2 [Sycon ciliatum]|uniref:uncharacterized protein LOC135821298 isoform X2 n=1 Tax=Sycon ciliatum TaxID=27933 RepID=UPI0020A9B668|eukprot:scpid97916/ scgid11919/ 